MAALHEPRTLAFKALLDRQQDTHVTLSCTQKKNALGFEPGASFFSGITIPHTFPRRIQKLYKSD